MATTEKVNLSNEIYNDLNTLSREYYLNRYNFRSTTYQVKPSYESSTSTFEYSSGGFSHSLTCVRTGSDFYVYSDFDFQTMALQKIGQFPSIADFHICQIKQYNKVLTYEQLKEFTMAIGLAANGVGTGSFVFLGRILKLCLNKLIT